MPDWFAITGAITNVATAFDLGYRYTPETTDENASVILKKIDEILSHSNTVVENHKDILDENIYMDLKDKYRELHWQMADESQGERAIRDEIIRQSRILSKLYASTQSRQERAQQLRKAAEAYQTDVLSASESASRVKRGRGLSLFPDAQTPLESPAPKAYTSWSSVFRKSKHSTPPSDIESSASSETPSLTSSSRPSSSNSISTLGESYIVAVTHLEDLSTQPSNTQTGTIQPSNTQTGTMYRRTITFEGGGKRIDIIDPKHHSLSENGECMDEEFWRNMNLLGEQLLSGGAPESDAHTTDSSPTPNKSLESAIQDFRRMSVSQ